MYASSELLIEDNTVLRSGRMGIQLGQLSQGRIRHNLVQDVGLLSKDVGLIYAWGTDGQGTEIAYNLVEGNRTVLGSGIYLDDGSKNHLVHHNLIQDVAADGLVIKEVNEVFNNTVVDAEGAMLGVMAPPAWHEDQTPVDLTEARVFNNVGPQVEAQVGLASALDGPYESTFSVTEEWQTVTVPFADLEYPVFTEYPLVNEGTAPQDLTSVTGVSFRIVSIGDFELWLDNVQLTNTSAEALVIDDFDDLDDQTPAGAGWWTTAEKSDDSCDECLSPTSALSFEERDVDDGAAKLSVYSTADGWHVAGVDTPSVDWSAYTAIQFDVRVTGEIQVQGRGGDGQYEHNADCPVDESGMLEATCGVDEGEVFYPYTDGFTGAAPDLGAFELDRDPWTAGATTTEDIWETCAMSLPE
jgi:hypothetical protein